MCMFIVKCPSWFRAVPCRGMADLFMSSDVEDRRLAVSVCDGCGFRGECLRFAVDNEITVGVWGGCTGPEVERLVRSGCDG